MYFQGLQHVLCQFKTHFPPNVTGDISNMVKKKNIRHLKIGIKEKNIFVI